ncbi:hypothetical protein [Psychroserpens luteus]|uniref:Uncharacterized protein n=1 Tax=Psychroserpens luteus TaxID=1434066 RepID=A0ABW5ZSM0_9FLAO|nr:hypothetical protein [Psychroserpens luteus]
MTIVDKKKTIKRIIDKLPDSTLDEVLFTVKELSSKDENRKEILLNLLKTEQKLFEKLAQ